LDCLFYPEKRTYTLLTAAILMIWAQAYLLVWEVGLLNGERIEWERFTSRIWIDDTIWVVVGLLACRYARQLAPKGVLIVSLLCLLQCAALLVTMTNASDALNRQSEFAQAAAMPDTTYRFSKEDNVLLVILDGFQSDVFDYIIREPRHGPVIQGALRGFVYYRGTMGAFPTTYMSVPAIVGEQIYSNQMPQADFMRQTMTEHSIMNAAMAVGYEVDLAAHANVLTFYIDSPHTNIFPIGHDDSNNMRLYRDAARLLDISLFRIAPHFFKRWIYNEQQWRIQTKLAGVGYDQF